MQTRIANPVITLAPANKTPTTDQARLAGLLNGGDLPAEVEAAIIEELTRPNEAGDTHHVAGAKREMRLRQLFAQLRPIDALELARRVDRDRNDDCIVVAFRRLATDRRQRLRGFLDSVRRRRA